MKKLLLVILFPTLLFGGKSNVQYDTITHGVQKPPTSASTIYDLDFTGLSIGGLPGGGGGGGTPGGADRQLQFNNAFTFGGVPYATYDGTSVTFRTGARFTLSDPTDATKRVQFALVNPTATLKTVTISDSSVTVIPSSVTPNQFVTNINTLGVAVTAQPLFSGMGGTLSLAQTTMSSGKIIGRYSAGTGVMQEITPDGTTVFLDSGTGVLSAAGGGGGTPGGSTTQFQYNNAGAFGGQNSLIFSGGLVQARDTVFTIFNTSDNTSKFNFSAANVPTATTETVLIPNSVNPVVVGGVSAVANQWVRYIDTLGVQQRSQPDFSNLSGSLSLGQQNIPIGKERFVDPTNGNDGTGAANLARPYLTIAAACAAASSGDVIYLYPNTTGYDQSTTPLVIPAGVTIVGAGPDTTLIKGAVTGVTRAVVEPSTASAIYNVSIQNTSSTGIAFGVGSSSAAFTSAYIGGSKVLAVAQGVYINKAGTTGLVAENDTISTQNDCVFQNISTASSEFRNCDLIADGTVTLTESKGLNVMNGTVRFDYGTITVGGATGTNVGAFASGASSVMELRGVRIANSLGGATNYDIQQQSSATVGKAGVFRSDAGALVTNGTVTELSRYAVIDNNLTDFPNIGAGTRGDIIYRGASGWTKLIAGIDGNVLTTHGNTADPTWATAGTGASVDDTAFGAIWNGSTVSAPSQNAVYDYLLIADTNGNGLPNKVDVASGMLKATANVLGAGVAGTDYTTSASTETFTNKRITRRQLSTAVPGPTPAAIDTDSYDVVQFTGMNADVTIDVTGTPNPPDTLRLNFTDDGTARAITWTAGKFEASPGQALPITTTAGIRLDMMFVRNSVTGKWRCLASSNAAAVSGAGTVTSVGISGANGITSSGGPITSSGSISLGLPITLAGTAGKTLTVSNSLTLAGTDGSTLNIGAGGTLGTNAFNSTAFLTSSAISDSVWASGWNGDTTTAPSKNAIYDWGHTFDTNDNGKVDVLDLTTAELVKTNASGVVSSATGGTDYANLAFKTVSVSGQTDVVADSAADTLTLVAGTGMTITTTAGTDTITLSSTGGGGAVSITGTSPIVLTPSPTTGTGVVSLDKTVDLALTGAQTITLNTAATNTSVAALNLTVNTTGTPANGLGVQLPFNAEDSTTISQIQGSINTAWVDVNHATSKAYMDFQTTSGGSSASAMRLWRGLSVGGTSDPGAGFINAANGFKVGGTAWGGTPGGSNTQVQFNDSSAFGGDSGLTFNKTTDALSVGGQIFAPIPDTTTPVYSFTGDTDTGWYGHSAGGIIVGTVNAARSWLLQTGENRIAASTLFGWSSADVFNALDTAIYRNAAGVVEINNGTAGTYRDLICRSITISGGNFSGRINPRASGGCDETSSATSTPNSDACDQWDITALAAADVFVAPSGTPVNGQNLIIRILDNGTARALTFPTASSGQYRFSSDMPAPTTTVISKTMYLGFKWNAAASRWDNVAQMNNF